MAKKVKKKVAKKIESQAQDPLEKTIDEMDDDEAYELIEAQDRRALSQSEINEEMLQDAQKENDKIKDREFQKVRIRIPVEIKINHKPYPPGDHIVERHLARQIIDMVNKKQSADLSITTGKSYLMKKLLDRSLVIKEVQELDSHIDVNKI